MPSAAFSRRSFLQLSAAASAALACRAVTEPMLAYAQMPEISVDGVRINANENPLGPCAAAREALSKIVPGRRPLSFRGDAGEFVDEYASSVRAKPRAGPHLSRFQPTR